MVQYYDRIYYIGTLPLEVHLASLGVGNYKLSVLATDTFNLTDESFVTFSGKEAQHWSATIWLVTCASRDIYEKSNHEVFL